MKPKKHAKLIKQWADGADIEYIDYDGRWYVINYPMWHDSTEYRIKPEPQKEQEPQYLYVYNHITTGENYLSPTLMRETSNWIYLGKVEVIK